MAVNHFSLNFERVIDPLQDLNPSEPGQHVVVAIGDANQNPYFYLGHGASDAITSAIQFTACLHPKDAKLNLYQFKQFIEQSRQVHLNRIETAVEEIKIRQVDASKEQQGFSIQQFFTRHSAPLRDLAVGLLSVSILRASSVPLPIAAFISGIVVVGSREIAQYNYRKDYHDNSSLKDGLVQKDENQIIVSEQASISIEHVQPENSSASLENIIEPEIIDDKSASSSFDANNNEKSEKLDRFYKKKVMPYLEAINNYKRIDRESEVSMDLESLLITLINNYHTIQCAIHPEFHEIIIKDGKKTYNLTQILLHNPNMNAINIGEQNLDKAYELLANPKIVNIIIPKKDAFPVDYQSLNVTQCNLALQRYFSSGNNDTAHFFTNHHPVYDLADSAYCGNGYVVINELLRTKTLSHTMFDQDEINSKSDRNARNAFIELRYAVKQGAIDDYLNPKEMARIIKEILLVVLIASKGLFLAKHPAYNPAEQTTLSDKSFSFESGRTYKGSNGSWVPELMKRYEMAYVGGTQAKSSLNLTELNYLKVMAKQADFVNTFAFDKSMLKHTIDDINSASFFQECVMR